MTAPSPAPAGTDAPVETAATLAELRQDVRNFLAEWRTEKGFVPRCDAWMRGYDEEFSRALAQRGWIGISMPRSVGGAGRSYLARLVVTEELLAAGAPVAAHWIADRQIGPAIVRYGSPALQAEFIPRITSGEALFCLGMSETEAGSDLAAVRTSAVRAADGWRISGRKIWTSHAHHVNYAYVLARSSTGADRHRGLTEFIVEMGAPGVTVRPILDLQGEHHFNELLLEDVFVPESRVLGQVDNGWTQVTEQLSFERGGAERVLSTYPLLASVLERLDDTATAAQLATVGELLGRLQVLRRMAADVARGMDQGRAPAREAAALKYLGTEFERQVVDVARDVMEVEAEPGAAGLAGMIADGILCAPGFTIRGGTSEMLLTIIARAELR